MAGSYLDVPLGRDYSFTTNVQSRLSDLGVSTMTNATLYFLAKSDLYWDDDAEAIINVTPTANVNTNVVTVTIPRVNTALDQVYPLLFWEVSMLTASNLFYTLDGGRMAISDAVQTSP